MPELPEVETTLRGITPHLDGRRVEKVQIWQPRLRWPVPPGLAELIEGASVVGLSRRGKYLQVAFAHGAALIHLGMSGSLRVADAAQPLRKHDHWQWQMDSGICLRYHDPRRFGALVWSPGQDQHPLLRSLGPEPLQADFTGDYLWRRSRGRSQKVKSFLMDSKVVVGVGNIYASESLFRAGIHPMRAAGRVSRVRYERLVREVRAVLSEAIESGGSTLRDYVNGSGSPGYFQQRLHVYGRAGLPCHSCQQPVQQVVIGQRSSFFCPACQV